MVILAQLQTATFAGGCFWCMIKPFDQYEGVKSVRSGYTGGHVVDPTYEEVKAQTTGHLEAVEIIFDQEVIRYETLLEIFFKIIDPTDEAGQFIDRGESYTTAVFYHDDTQKRAVESHIAQLEKSGIYSRPIVTKVRSCEPFYLAEEYHQDYYKKNPQAYAEEYRISGREAYFKNKGE